MTEELKEKVVKTNKPYKKRYNRKPYMKKTEENNKEIEEINTEITTQEVVEEKTEKYVKKAKKEVGAKKTIKPVIEKKLVSPTSNSLKRERLKIIPLGGLEEVGKKFNVTRERIRQIEAKALRKLRHPSRAKKLKDFLSE